MIIIEPTQQNEYANLYEMENENCDNYSCSNKINGMQ